jgi:hypothetical protein
MYTGCPREKEISCFILNDVGQWNLAILRAHSSRETHENRTPQVMMTVGILGFLCMYGLPLAWRGTCRNWYGKYLFLCRGNRHRKKQQEKEPSTIAIAAAQ